MSRQSRFACDIFNVGIIDALGDEVANVIAALTKHLATGIHLQAIGGPILISGAAYLVFFVWSRAAVVGVLFLCVPCVPVGGVIHSVGEDEACIVTDVVAGVEDVVKGHVFLLLYMPKYGHWIVYAVIWRQVHFCSTGFQTGICLYVGVITNGKEHAVGRDDLSSFLGELTVGFGDVSRINKQILFCRI